MRLGLLADVHGNSVALRACLERLEPLEVDDVYFVGDAIGYLPDAAACLERLEAVGAHCQQGNHEAMLLSVLSGEAIDAERDAVYGLRVAGAQLGPELRERIASWPEWRELTVGDRRMLLVHGSPQDPLFGYVYADREPERFIDPAYDVIVMGHTHRPFTREVGERLLVNVGSVGLPRDVGNLATFAVYDSATGRAAIYRVEFDVDEVLERWGAEIHEQTAAVLARRAPSFEGEWIA